MLTALYKTSPVLSNCGDKYGILKNKNKLTEKEDMRIEIGAPRKRHGVNESKTNTQLGNHARECMLYSYR